MLETDCLGKSLVDSGGGKETLQSEIKIGDLFMNHEMISALTCHPDEHKKQILSVLGQEEELKKVERKNIGFVYGAPKTALIVSVEEGETFEYMKCNFVAKICSYVPVKHYQILVNEKVYWQSFKSEQDFLKVWMPLNETSCIIQS